jgi:hypothetical protein
VLDEKLGEEVVARRHLEKELGETKAKLLKESDEHSVSPQSDDVGAMTSAEDGSWSSTASRQTECNALKISKLNYASR